MCTPVVGDVGWWLHGDDVPFQCLAAVDRTRSCTYVLCRLRCLRASVCRVVPLRANRTRVRLYAVRTAHSARVMCAARCVLCISQHRHCSYKSHAHACFTVRGGCSCSLIGPHTPTRTFVGRKTPCVTERWLVMPERALLVTQVVRRSDPTRNRSTFGWIDTLLVVAGAARSR